MGCGCNKTSTDIKYELTNPDGSKQTFDTRAEATTVREPGGKIRPVRVSS